MSVEILMNDCQGAPSPLLRVEGSCSKGSEATKNNLAQRAKCGVCPCCVTATHVLVPTTYNVGKCDCRKRNTTKLWQKYGQMANRNYAAAVYFNLYGPLPSAWPWIATKHLVMLPPPLDPEASFHVEAESARPGDA